MTVPRPRLQLILIALLAFAACAPPPPADVTDSDTNPLPPCPGTPNCVRETRVVEAPPDSVFATALEALQRMEPADLDARPQEHRIDAVFKVFVFKDDFALAVTPHTTGAALHIRSASRVGKSDLGVNRRRVNRFYEQFGLPL